MAQLRKKCQVEKSQHEPKKTENLHRLSNTGKDTAEQPELDILQSTGTTEEYGSWGCL